MDSFDTNVSSYELEDLFDIKELEQLQDEVANVLQVASVITKPDGTPITHESNFTTFCSKLVRKSPNGKACCEKSDAVMGKPNKEGPTIAICQSAGLMDAGVSIMVGEHHLANWIIGQVIDPQMELNDGKLRARARKLHIDEEQFIKEFHKVPRMSESEFRKAAQMLFILANKISAQALETVRSRELLKKYEQVNKELSIEKERLLAASIRDSLTGLYNRRYFEEKMVELDKREYLPLSIISVDANNLKITNDILGHMYGDKLLCKVGEIMSAYAREGDVICRCGGDEFNAILPNTTREEADAYIAKVLEECANNRIDFLPVSIAMGCDVRMNRRIGMTSVLKNAEEKMYNHKRKIKSKFNVVWVAESQIKKRGYVCDAMYGRLFGLLDKFAKRLGYDENTADRLHAEASLMYVGMVCIPEEIFFKETPLTETERKIYQRYPLVGYQILKLHDETQFAAPIIRQIQERYDGKGYPQGLSGDEINQDAKVLSLIKTYMFLSGEQVHYFNHSKEEIIQEFETGCGTQFDPDMCRVFIELLKEELS